MIKFARHKTSDEIRAQCRLQRIECDDRKYKEGSDFIVVRGGGAEAFYNVVSGRFFGTTPKGVEFSSDTDKHDSKPWMQGLLNFFYVGK